MKKEIKKGNCLKCGKEFLVGQKRLSGEKKEQKYCSRECLHSQLSKIIKCANCGKKVFRKPSRIIRYEQSFCSRECASIKNRKNLIRANFKRIKEAAERKLYQRSWVRFSKCADCSILYCYHIAGQNYRCDLCNRIKKFDDKVKSLKNVKICIDCGEFLTVKYSRNRCRTCANEAKLVYRKIHNKKNRKKFRENHRKEYLAEKKRYRERNFGKILKRGKIYREEQRIAYHAFVLEGVMPIGSLKKHAVVARRMAKQLNII